jgi:ornithine carbamoyltransferase
MEPNLTAYSLTSLMDLGSSCSRIAVCVSCPSAGRSGRDVARRSARRGRSERVGDTAASASEMSASIGVRTRKRLWLKSEGNVRFQVVLA